MNFSDEPRSREEHWYDIEEISRGSFGRVVKQTGTRDGRNGVRVVKKIEMHTGSKSLDYKRELEALREFSQGMYEPYFVKAYEWYMDEKANLMCIAMEYVEHGNMRQYIGELNGKCLIEENDAGLITMQLLQGLYFMHKKGYAHRDIKPANILFHSKPPEPLVKIADFGISKLMKDETESTLRFTWNFQSPEVDGYKESKKLPDGAQDDTPRDIWALGEICFQMLTKKPTFGDAKSRSDYFRGEAKFPVDILKSCRVPEPAQNFIERAMKVEPTDRITAEAGCDHQWIKPFYTASSDKRVFGVLLETSMDYAKSTNRAFQCRKNDYPMSGGNHVFEVLMTERTLPIIFAECGQYLIHIVYDMSCKQDLDRLQDFNAQKSPDRIGKLKEHFNRSPRFGRSPDWDGCTVRDVLQLLLDFLREHPEPILTSDFLVFFIKNRPGTIFHPAIENFADSFDKYSDPSKRCRYHVFIYCLYLMDFLKCNRVLKEIHDIVPLFGFALLHSDKKIEPEGQDPFTYMTEQINFE